MNNQITEEKTQAKEFKGFASKEQYRIWELAQKGIFAFCVIHFALELIDFQKSAEIMVVINYFISAWIIKSQIKNGKQIDKPFWRGVTVSLIVFICRWIIGFLFVSIL